MATGRSRTNGVGAASTSSRDDDDEARDNVRSPGDFLRGERTWLWPVWVLALLMLLVILGDRFGLF